MIKNVAAIIVAAVCAGVIVGVAPGVAVGSSQTAEPPVAAVAGTNRPMNGAAPAGVDSRAQRETACARNWPYYEQACLRGSRQSDGKASGRRIIAIDRLTKSAVSQARD